MPTSDKEDGSNHRYRAASALLPKDTIGQNKSLRNHLNARSEADLQKSLNKFASARDNFGL